MHDFEVMVSNQELKMLSPNFSFFNAFLHLGLLTLDTDLEWINICS